MNRNQLALVTALSVLQFLTGTAQHFLTHTILLPLVAPLFPKHPFKQGRVEAQSPRKCQYQSEIVINHLKPSSKYFCPHLEAERAVTLSLL